MGKSRLVSLSALLLALPPLSNAAAPCYTMDAKKSSLTFSAEQMGAPFGGKFGKFSAAIRFDAADLAGSSFDVTVDIASADTQEAQRDGTLQGPDFLDVEHFKAARFVTTAITKTQAGSFAATGKLTLRSVTRDVTIAFGFTRRKEGAADVSYLAGSANLKRLDFGIGRGEYADTAVVGNDVRIKFNLRLLPAARPPDKKIPTPPARTQSQ